MITTNFELKQNLLSDPLSRVSLSKEPDDTHANANFDSEVNANFPKSSTCEHLYLSCDFPR